MEIIRNFILIVLIAMFLIYILSKIMLKESFILNRILRVVNNITFDTEALIETRNLLELILSVPDSIQYDITGDSTFINNLYLNIRAVTYLEARDIINKLMTDLNEQLTIKKMI